jgi:hypothetical protein
MNLFRWLGYGYWLFMGVMVLFALPLVWSRLGPGPFILVGVIFVGSMLIGPFVRWMDKTRFGKWFDRQEETLIQAVVAWRWMVAFFLTVGLLALEWISPWLALTVLAFIVGRVYGKGGAWL